MLPFRAHAVFLSGIAAELKLKTKGTLAYATGAASRGSSRSRQNNSRYGIPTELIAPFSITFREMLHCTFDALKLAQSPN